MIRWVSLSNDERDSHNNPSFFSDTKDMSWDAICRGSMWVKLGVVQSLILSPVGPVDPVMKNSIELQHVNETVTAPKL